VKSLMQIAAIGAFLATAAQFSAAGAAETTPANGPASTATTTQPVQTAQNAPTTATPNTRGRKRASQAAVAQPSTTKNAYDEAIELNEKIHAFMPVMSGDGGGG
jgi:hypothetical protein